MIKEIFHAKNESGVIMNVNATNTGFNIRMGRVQDADSWNESVLTDDEAETLARRILAELQLSITGE